MSSGDRVLFIHGFMGSALNWGPIRTRLESRIPTLKTQAVDLLGHAKRHPDSEQLEKSSSAHQALCQTLQEDIKSFAPTHLVAHSFGLRPVLLLGQKVDSAPHLIVEDSSPELSSEGYHFLSEILERTPVPFQDRIEAKQYFDKSYGNESALSRFLLSNVRSRPDSGLVEWRFDKNFLLQLLTESYRQNLWKEWSHYPGPVDLIYGSRSPGLNSSLIERMRKELNHNLGVHPIEGAGHWVHHEKPEAFVSTLTLILGSQSLGYR